MQAANVNINTDDLSKFLAQVNGDLDRVYSDKRIELLADCYEHLKGYESGVLFEDFFLAMSGHSDRSLMDHEPGTIPLCRRDHVIKIFLQQQSENGQHKLEIELEEDQEVTCRNGTYTEPLRQHHHPRRKPVYNKGKKS